jgi:hypothetical protein
VSQTIWRVIFEDDGEGTFGSPSGRRFAVGDEINLPPPGGKGDVWRVVAVEDAPGYEGCLRLARSYGDGRRRGQL